MTTKDGSTNTYNHFVGVLRVVSVKTNKQVNEKQKQQQ